MWIFVTLTNVSGTLLLFYSWYHQQKSSIAEMRFCVWNVVSVLWYEFMAHYSLVTIIQFYSLPHLWFQVNALWNGGVFRWAEGSRRRNDAGPWRHGGAKQVRWEISMTTLSIRLLAWCPGNFCIFVHSTNTFKWNIWPRCSACKQIFPSRPRFYTLWNYMLFICAGVRSQKYNQRHVMCFSADFLQEIEIFPDVCFTVATKLSKRHPLFCHTLFFTLVVFISCNVSNILLQLDGSWGVVDRNFLTFQLDVANVTSLEIWCYTVLRLLPFCSSAVVTTSGC